MFGLFLGAGGELVLDLCFRKITLVLYDRLTLKGEPESRETSQEAVYRLFRLVV